MDTNQLHMREHLSYSAQSHDHPLLMCLSLECDFEESHLCGYSNQWNANVNWYVGGGGIQIVHNAMPNDHTYNNKTGELCAVSVSIQKN